MLSSRPAVTFPAAGHHRPWPLTKLYCSVTEAQKCEQLAQGAAMIGRESNSGPNDSKFDDLPIAPPCNLLTYLLTYTETVQYSYALIYRKYMKVKRLFTINRIIIIAPVALLHASDVLCVKSQRWAVSSRDTTNAEML